MRNNHEEQKRNQQTPPVRRRTSSGGFDMISEREKTVFLKHFAVYFLAVMLSAYANNHIFTDHQWWLVFSLGWGIAVLLHFIYLYIIKPRILLYREDQA